jgi:predicted Zn-dependent protease with MMP-like domain
MGKFKVPKTIKIVGRNYSVVLDKELTNKTDNVGEVNYRYNRILIQSSVDGQPVQEQDIKVTLLHEITHCILFAMEENDLRCNEKFVGAFSEILYQVLKDNKLNFE